MSELKWVDLEKIEGEDKGWANQLDYGF